MQKYKKITDIVKITLDKHYKLCYNTYNIIRKVQR